jgi:hypothetical protein
MQILIPLLWAIIVPRLAFAAIGQAAPSLLKHGLFVVLVSVIGALAGAGIGTAIYACWPQGSRATEFRPGLSTMVRTLLFALPLLYLLWPVLVTLPWYIFLPSLAGTMIPCLGHLVPASKGRS